MVCCARGWVWEERRRPCWGAWGSPRRVRSHSGSERERLKGFMKRKMLRPQVRGGRRRVSGEGKRAEERNKDARGDLMVRRQPVSSIILIIFQLTYN